MSGAQDTTKTPTENPGEKTIAEKMFPGQGEGGTPNTPPPAAPPANPADKPAEGTPPPAEAKPNEEDIKEVTLPENAVIGESDLASIKEYAKEHGLTNKQAQALVEKQNKTVSEYVERQVEAYKTEIAGYEGAIKADKEMGGTNYNRTVELSNRALNGLASEGLINKLNESGMRNHPELVRFLAKIGSHLSDDQMVNPNAKPVTPPKSFADKFYNKN